MANPYSVKSERSTKTFTMLVHAKQKVWIDDQYPQSNGNEFETSLNGLFVSKVHSTALGVWCTGLLESPSG